MRRLVIEPPAREDMRSLLKFSRARFGREAGRQYRALIEHAFEELREDPQRAGVQPRHALSPGVHLYHLRNTRHGMPSGSRPKGARHFIVFCISGGDIVILRVLHDAMDIPRHIGAEPSDE